MLDRCIALLIEPQRRRIPPQHAFIVIDRKLNVYSSLSLTGATPNTIRSKYAEVDAGSAGTLRGR
jgi:hypothetical protein